MTRVFRIIGDTIRSLGLADQPHRRRGGRT